MRVLMLGWEFPPFIAGGLGTACYGLTRALDRLGHEVLFVLPRPIERSQATHIRLISPDAASGGRAPDAPASPAGAGSTAPGSAPGQGLYRMEGFDRAHFLGVAAAFSSPYPTFTPDDPVPARRAAALSAEAALREAGVDPGDEFAVGGPIMPIGGAGGQYSGDVVGDAERYARLVVSLTRREPFDVVHAHDWMTFPAGQAIARVTGRPLVVHVHSTEFDRSGEHVNQRVYEIERRGMHAAHRVVAVSMLTKSICVRRYGVAPGKIDVVYNGIDHEEAQPAPGAGIGARDKIVLFLGRITMQKGPEYFVAAAKRVLEKIDNVKFVVAGSGDLAVRMIEQAAQLGIGHKVLFTGFLRGKDVERVFQMADCYVMPSVSEPFGLAALEAVRSDVPVIISKQSGVAEVLSHALKVDFWDIDEMANKIIAVLRHPPLSQTLRQHGPIELKRLTWDVASEGVVEAYQRAAAGHKAGVN